MFRFSDTFTDTEARDASPIILREPNLNSREISPASLYAKPLAVSHLAISFLLYARPIVKLFFLPFRDLLNSPRNSCVVESNVFFCDTFRDNARQVQSDLLRGRRRGGDGGGELHEKKIYDSGKMSSFFFAFFAPLACAPRLRPSPAPLTSFSRTQARLLGGCWQGA